MWPRRTTLPFLGYMVPSFGSEPSVHIVSREKWVWTTWKKLVYHHRPTQQPLPFRLNNNREKEGRTFSLGHLWVIWAHLLAQNTQSIWYLGKLRFEAFWRSWLLTTEPPNSLVLLSWIMIRLLERPQNHFAIFGLYELIFWLRTPSPYTISEN